MKHFHYRSGKGLNIPGVISSQISKQSAHVGDKVVRPTDRPPFRTRKHSWYSFLLLTTGWTVRDRIPVGTRYSASPDRPCGPPSLLYNGNRVFPRCKVREGGLVLLTTHHLLVLRSLKSTAISLPTLWATLGL